MEVDLQKVLGNPAFHLTRYRPDQVDHWNERLGRKFSAEGEQTSSFDEEETAFVLNELTLSKWDALYWMERYCWIASDSAHLERLSLRNSQRKLFNRIAEIENEERPLPRGKVGLVIAKARRVGATILSQALMAHGAMLRGQTKALIAADIPEKSLELFQIQDRIYKHLPLWMRPHLAGRVKSAQLYFDKLDSEIIVGHGAQKNPMGQGIRLDFVHLTEASTWLQVGIAQVDEDIYPAFDSSKAPTTAFIIESTGRSGLDGTGLWFEEQYKLAKEGQSNFGSVFLSWYDAPEVWARNADGLEWTTTTLGVKDRIKRDTGYELSKEQMAWYQITRKQYEAKQELSTFLREFPSTDFEAFAYGLPCAWPIEVIDKTAIATQEPLVVFDVDVRHKRLLNGRPSTDWDRDPNCRVLIWEKCLPGFTYVVGVDASYGATDNGKSLDSASIFVNRVGNRFARDKQVAEFWGKIPPDELAAVCWCLGHAYTDRETELPAMMAIECNPGSPGMMTQTELLKMNYPHFYTWRKENSTTGGWTTQLGWYTTGSTRPLLTKTGVKAIMDNEWQINSSYFVDEMRTFVNYGPKIRRGVDEVEYFAHAPGKHDDRIFAGFIARYVSHDYDRQNIADERRKYYEGKLAASAPPDRSNQYQCSDLTSDEAFEEFEARLPF